MRMFVTTALSALALACTPLSVAWAACASDDTACQRAELTALAGELNTIADGFRDRGNTGAEDRWRSAALAVEDSDGGISLADARAWLAASEANGWATGKRLLPQVIAAIESLPALIALEAQQAQQQQVVPQTLACDAACQTLVAELNGIADGFRDRGNTGAERRWRSAALAVEGSGDGLSLADAEAWLADAERNGWSAGKRLLPQVIAAIEARQSQQATKTEPLSRTEALRAAIGRGSTEADGSPTGIAMSRTSSFGPTAINIQSSDTGVRWDNVGSAPVAPGTRHYDGFKLTRIRDAQKIIDNGDGTTLTTTVGVGETAYVWTDIDGPSAKPFHEAYTLNVDTDADGTNDALAIDSFNWSLVTNYARAADDDRDGDTSPGAMDRGIVDQNRQFNQGHEIGARFNGVYGVLTCVDQICTINMDGFDLTEMAGWAFTPKVLYDGQGGSRSPQVLVGDNDYRYFGYWLRGPDHATDGGFDIRTFAGGSEVYSGDTYSLTGRATYVGPAGGLYVKDTDGGGSSDGHFTAKVTLHADFGSKQTIAGSMSDFRDGNRGLGWSLYLQQTSILGADFSGTTRGATYTGSPDNLGSYDGTFYGGGEGDYPNGVAGTFTGKFDDGAVIGGFGANREVVHPNHP